MATDKQRQRLLRLIVRAFKKRTDILKISGVLGYSVGFREKAGKVTDEPALVVYVRKGRKKKKASDFPRRQRIPQKIRMWAGKKTIWIRIDLIETGKGKLHNAGSIISGNSVANCESADNTGTIGWIARRRVNDEPVFCSNFHVFLRKPAYAGSNLEKEFHHDPNHPERIISPGGMDGGIWPNDAMGSVVHGKRNQLVDAAIAAADKPELVAKFIKFIGAMAAARRLQAHELDPQNPIAVSLSGRTSQLLAGKIREYPASHEFAYPDRAVMLFDLIAADLPTQGGDSGALLVDASLHPMGMLVGRAGNRAFFMHIGNIMSEMKLKEF
jgi:hypothetical protein